MKGADRMSTRTVDNPKIVSREKWFVARKKLLAKEKCERDTLAAERCQLAWVKVEKKLRFQFPQRQENIGRSLRREQPAHYCGLGTQVFLIAFGAQ